MFEQDLEEYIVKKLKEQGFQYFYGPDVDPNSSNPIRKRFEDFLLEDIFRNSLKKINPEISKNQENKIIELFGRKKNNLVETNKYYHDLILNGANIDTKIGKSLKSRNLKIIDFKNINKNQFTIVNQFSIKGKETKRPDIVIFVNGLPIIIVELKNPYDVNADVISAFKQIKNYQNQVSELFYTNNFNIISDGFETRIGTITSNLEWYRSWRNDENKYKSNLNTVLYNLLSKENILNILSNYTIVEKGMSSKDGLIKSTLDKKICGYHQYRASENSYQKVIKCFDSNKEKKGGIIWHSPGAGKSLTMLFLAGKIGKILSNPSILVLTDRSDLDNQLLEDFSKNIDHLKQKSIQIKSIKDLKSKLKINSGGIFFSTIQKFYEEIENKFELLSDRSNFLVLVDEAHRTQYGFSGKIKNKKNNISYGYAKYLRDAFPNASFVGFTGTPVDQKDRNTQAVFGPYNDIYDNKTSEEDGNTTQIFYEPRFNKIKNNKPLEHIDEEFKQINFENLNIDSKKLLTKHSSIKKFYSRDDRIKDIVNDFVNHFEMRQKVSNGKAMIVCLTRKNCIKFFNNLKKLRPTWFKKDDSKGKVKCIITGNNNKDPKNFHQHIRSKDKRKFLAKRFKNPNDELKITIVCDIWLTGQNFPVLDTMYLDKPLKGHTLMQTVSRVNRVFKDKPGGLIVDYACILDDLKEAVNKYTSENHSTPIYDFKILIPEIIKIDKKIKSILEINNFRNFDKLDVMGKINSICKLQEIILSKENGKNKFINLVLQLNKIYSLIPNEKPSKIISKEIPIYNAIKSRILKYENVENFNKNEKVETFINNLVDKSFKSEGVKSIYEISGIKNPPSNILSAEFLDNLKKNKNKNIITELLKFNILKEIKAQNKKNIFRAEKLSEKLQKTLNKYNNKFISTLELLDELIAISKEINAKNNSENKLGLSSDEIAFYDVLDVKDSSVEALGDKNLALIAKLILQEIRKNKTIDWNLKESTRAKIRLLVKKILRKYGYPPKKADETIKKIFKQAELIELAA